MPISELVLEEIVTANRILAREGVLDSFGHVSLRNPENPETFLLSRARAPECIEAGDIIEFNISDGSPIDAAGRKPYAERFIHSSIYMRRPKVQALVHNHSPSVVPFSVTGKPLKPIMHMCASMGAHLPIWDSRSKFGDTNLLVTNMALGDDLADALGDNRAALMRGHGCVVIGESLREVVFASVYLELNADLQMRASTLGEITFLSEGEIDEILKTRSSFTFERAWERWCGRAGRPYDFRPMEGPLAKGS